MTVSYRVPLIFVLVFFLFSITSSAQFILLDELTAAISSNTMGGKERFAGYQLGINSRLPTKGGTEDRSRKLNFTSTVRLTWRKFRPINTGFDPVTVTALELGVGPEFTTSGPLRLGLKGLLAIPLSSQGNRSATYKMMYPGLVYEAFFAFTPRFMLGLEGTILTGPVDQRRTGSLGPSTIDSNIRWLTVGTRVRLW